MESQINKNAALSEIDEMINHPDLLDEPKGALLFIAYKLTKIFQPEVAEEYWAKLHNLGNALPARYKSEYNEIRTNLNPAKEVKRSKFQSEMLGMINDAKPLTESDPSKAKVTLVECRDRISKRWWALNRSVLWHELIPVLFMADHDEAIAIVGKLSSKLRENQVIEWNRNTPLTVQEWLLLYKTLGEKLFDILEAMVAEGVSRLDISEGLYEKLGNKLKNNIHYRIVLTTPTEEQKEQAEDKREKSYQGFKKLITIMCSKYPGKTRELMESLFSTIMSTDFYTSEKDWVDRISKTVNFLNFWKEIADEPEKVVQYINEKAPKHLKCFSLAHWHANTSKTDESAEKSFNELASDQKDLKFCKAWFLIVLVRQGRGLLAYKLAKQSEFADSLTPRVLRDWILTNSADVRKSVPAEELPNDFLSTFFLLPTIEEQVECLRNTTDFGKKPLPSEFWRLPDFMDLYEIISSNDFMPLDAKEHLFSHCYLKTASNNDQVCGYVKQFGFGQYAYGEIDFAFISVLNKWDTLYPEEVSSLFSLLWSKFIPGHDQISVDLIRNALFVRYKDVFSVCPDLLHKHFIKWVKENFVDNAKTWTVGQMTYTFSLKDVAPFIYALQAAQTISTASPDKCDQIITYAISNYRSNESLIRSAAMLYVSDKKKLQITPPAKLFSKEMLKSWQMGVIDGSLDKITRKIVEGFEKMAQQSLAEETTLA